MIERPRNKNLLQCMEGATLGPVGAPALVPTNYNLWPKI